MDENGACKFPADRWLMFVKMSMLSKKKKMSRSKLSIPQNVGRDKSAFSGKKIK